MTILANVILSYGDSKRVYYFLGIVESLYLSLLQSRLDLRLLCLHCLLGLLQFMDALASLSDLLGQVRDLLCDLKKKHSKMYNPMYLRWGNAPHATLQLTLQVLVLSLQSLQLVKSLLIGVLHLEELCAERTSLLLSSLQLSLALLKLLLPLCKNLGRNT